MHQSFIRSHATARRRIAFRALLAAIALLMAGTLASPQVAVSAALAPTVLGTAQSFLVLGGSTVTNTGPTTVTGGNLGVSPGTATPGFPPGIVVAPGAIHATDAVAAQAQIDVTTAYNTLASQARTATLTGQDLGGKTLTQGVYFFATAAQLTGQLTLDAKGDPSAVFVFQIGSTLTTASNASVLLTNGASPCNVYWQIGSSATLGTTTRFVGNIVALTSISLNTGVTVIGRALARNGAVTLDTNTFTAGGCAPTIPPAPLPATAVPAPVIPATPAPLPGTPATVVPAPGTPATAVPVPGTPVVPIGIPTAPIPVIATPVAAIATPVTTVATPVAAIATPITTFGTPVTTFGTPVAAFATPSVPGVPVGNVTSGGSTPISATLPLVGSPVNATAPIPVAMPNTGRGGLATQFTASSAGVNDHRTSGIQWMVIAALVALTAIGLLFVRRARR